MPDTPNHTENILWNDNIEKVVKNIGNDCKAFKIMHINVAMQNTKYYNIFMLLGIVLGPLSGTIGAIGSALDEKADPTFPIIAAIVAFMSGMIIAIIKFGKHDEVSILNKSTAAKYISLETNIRRQLSLYRNNRLNSYKYLEWVTTSYEKLFESAPLISTSIQNEYVKNYNTSLPGMINAEIEINNTSIHEVVNTEEIVINIDDNSIKKLPEPEDVRGGDAGGDARGDAIGDKKEKKNKKCKNSEKIGTTTDFNQFADGEMKYQMGRMFGFK